MMISCRLGETMEIFLGSECLGRSGSDTTGVCVCVCLYKTGRASAAVTVGIA